MKLPFHLYPHLLSGLSVFCFISSPPNTHARFLTSFSWCLFFYSFSLCVHMLSVRCPCASPFLFLILFPLSHWLACKSSLHLYPLKEVHLFPRQTGWSLGGEGRWGENEEEVQMLGHQWREVIADIQNMCCCVRVLSSGVFVGFYFFFIFFLYRLCDQSLMHSLASFSGKLSRVQNAYL